MEGQMKKSKWRITRARNKIGKFKMIMNSDEDNEMSAENNFQTKTSTEAVHHARFNYWLIFMSGFNILITLFVGFSLI